MNNLTVFNLFHFMPINDREKEIFNFDENIINELKKKLHTNWFYLGGQVKMNHNDFINLDSIRNVEEINERRKIEYGEPCNSIELQSINRHKELLKFVETMIIKYNEIMQIREINNSELSTLNDETKKSEEISSPEFNTH